MSKPFKGTNLPTAMSLSLFTDSGNSISKSTDSAILSSAIIPFQTGIDLYAGGRWDRIKQTGIRIARFLTETDAIKAVGQIKEWFQKNGKQGERLGAVILRKDLLEFQDEVLQGINRDDWSEITPEAEESFRIAI